MISVNLEKSKRPLINFWNHIHFHPTDAIEDDWGQEILNEIAADKAAKTVRLHAMLEDIVTRDENGGFKYDFKLTDLRLNYLISHGFDILLCYDFIPPCIASDPDLSATVTKSAKRYKGKVIVTSPPKDYGEWEEICYRYTEHLVNTFGIETVSKWHLHCYNEPDVQPFFMSNLPDTPAYYEVRCKEYKKLYEGFARAAKRVSEKLCIGGPALACRAEFLDSFLKFTKENNVPIDFVDYHHYGTNPDALNYGRRPFNENFNLEYSKEYVAVIRKYYPDIEIMVSEWGMATAGYYNIDDCPLLIQRDTSCFAAYFGKMVYQFITKRVPITKMLICLSGQHEMRKDFAGCRTFFTLNHIKKPIYNAYILMGKLKNNFCHGASDIMGLNVIPTVDDGGSAAVILAYASENYNVELPKINDTVKLLNISGKVHVTTYVIDREHTNPYGMFERCGFREPMKPTEIDALKSEGTLKAQLSYDTVSDGEIEVPVSFTSDALVLVEANKI